jgi:hypothetical protein
MERIDKGERLAIVITFLQNRTRNKIQGKSNIWMLTSHHLSNRRGEVDLLYRRMT